MSSELLPHRILSGCGHICTFFPDVWAINWTAGVPKERGRVRVQHTRPRLPDVLSWANESFGKAFGYPRVLYSRRDAAAALAVLAPPVDSVVLFGLGLPKDLVDEFLHSASLRAPEQGRAPVGGTGYLECLSRGEPLAHGGSSLGYELLSSAGFGDVNSIASSGNACVRSPPTQSDLRSPTRLGSQWRGAPSGAPSGCRCRRCRSTYPILRARRDGRPGRRRAAAGLEHAPPARARGDTGRARRRWRGAGATAGVARARRGARARLVRARRRWRPPAPRGAARRTHAGARRSQRRSRPPSRLLTLRARSRHAAPASGRAPRHRDEWRARRSTPVHVGPGRAGPRAGGAAPWRRAAR